MLTNPSSDSSAPKADDNLGYIRLISAVAAMGGLLFDWAWAVIGGAKPFFQRYFDLTRETQIGWANSYALIGCLSGALLAGALSDRFGRKRLLALGASCFVLTCIFPLSNKALGAADTFWIYAAVCACGFVIIMERLPETKTHPLEGIEKKLVG